MLYPTELRAEIDLTYKKSPLSVSFFVYFVVGVQGFEPWTPWSQTRCATRLRHTPTSTRLYLENYIDFLGLGVVEPSNSLNLVGFGVDRIYQSKNTGSKITVALGRQSLDSNKNE